MSTDGLEMLLRDKLDDLQRRGTRKGKESVITAVIPAGGTMGPRFLIAGCGNKAFLRMNANSYLGLSLHPDIIAAEERAVRDFGTGPGAVRFISGTYKPHEDLEKRLAKFHNREAGMLFSSAYAAVMGVITPLIQPDSMILSDELNHNCIINAARLARPKAKAVYAHLDMGDLEEKIKGAVDRCRHLLIVTDGIFSMRGDHAPLDRIAELAETHGTEFEAGITTVVDDSHGVGAFGSTGRGTEEYTGAGTADLLIATLGKALGVNGGYVVSTSTVIDYLRETSPFYVYSNPITPAEAAAALRAVEILDGEVGRGLLERLRFLTRRFETGLIKLGYEIISSDHPVVPVMVRDTAKTARLVEHLYHNGILATGLNYPVVPKGDEEIRFQVSADHTEFDIDAVLAVLEKFRD
jgi:glycine C-acetyltransferase